MKKNNHMTMRQASVSLGIPYYHIQCAKELYPECFNKSGKLVEDLFVKWYGENKDKIVEKEKDSIQGLEKQKLINQIILQEIEIEEAKKLVVTIKDVEEFMAIFGMELSAVLKARIIKELPPRIAGLKQEDVIEVCKEFYNELVELLKKNIENWNLKNDN